MTTRGIRNHNPGNIEKGAPWQGLASNQTSDSRFAVFESPEWGIRAIARVLITYQDKRRAGDGSKIDTVQEIVDRWAPPHENDTNAYAAHVRQMLGLVPGEKIDVRKYDTMKALVEAIIKHENGHQPYDDKVINKGLVLAGIDVPPKPLEKSRTVKAGTVAAAATGVGMVGEVVQQVAPAMPLVETIGRYAPWALGVLVIAAIGYMLWCRMQDQKVRIG